MVGISTDVIIDKAYFKWLCPFSFGLSAENPACMMASPFAEIFLRSNVDRIGTLSALKNQEPLHEKDDSIVRYIDYAFYGILPSALLISD
jgi:3-isopropylmalate dehydratase small subunit